MKAIAIDGTEIKAWNSRNRNHMRSVVEKQLAGMDKKISEYLKEMDENDDKEKIESMRKRMKKLREIKKSMDQSGLDEMSLTDPDARLMKTCRGMEICFNGQISFVGKKPSHCRL